MHRVLNLNAIGISEEATENHKLVIRAELEQYDLWEVQVNDGHDENNQPTLAISADFNHVDNANGFHTWLKGYIVDNATDFSFARTRIHDCHHAEGLSLPCMIGDVWNMSQGL